MSKYGVKGPGAGESSVEHSTTLKLRLGWKGSFAPHVTRRSGYLLSHCYPLIGVVGPRKITPRKKRYTNPTQNEGNPLSWDQRLGIPFSERKLCKASENLDGQRVRSKPARHLAYRGLRAAVDSIRQEACNKRIKGHSKISQ